MSGFRKATAGAAIAAVLVFGATPGASAQGDGASKPITLTAEQETCMAAAKTAAKGQTGAARKATIKSAAQACGVWKRFAKLTSEQQACLAANGLKRPTGAPTKAHKKQLRSLAAKCGVALRVKG